MATASWRTYRRHNWMRPSKLILNRSIGRRVIAFSTFSNIGTVRHLELEFCHCGPPTKSTVRFDYPVKIWYRLDLRRRKYWFCQFGSNVPNHPLFGNFWGLNPLKLWVVIKTNKPKRCWVRTCHLSHKRLRSVQGCDLGVIPRKKV